MFSLLEASLESKGIQLYQIHKTKKEGRDPPSLEYVNELLDVPKYS